MINSFGLSVEELMKLDIMKNAKILSGIAGMDRRITKMNVMEVPDILDWVSSGEFLLTTAYSIKDDIHQLDELIPKLSKKNIAGIGIKTKRYIENVPKSIIEKSNEYKFPIIEIPYDVSFSEIIMPALTEIINKQSSVLTQTYEFHNRLIDTILHGGSLQEIADAIYQSVENPVMICEMIFKTHVLSSEKDFKNKVEYVYEEKFNYITKIEVEDIIDGKAVKRVIIPIKIDEKVYGYINIWEMNRKLTPLEITIINSSTPIITLDLMKKQSIFQVENKHRTEFFDNLFSEDDIRVKQAFENKIFFDFRHDKEYSVLVINASEESYLIEKLTKILDGLISNEKDQIIYANKGNKIIVLIGNDRSEENINYNKKFAKEIIDIVLRARYDSRITIGVGRSYQNVYEVRKSYNEASRVVDYIGTRDDINMLHYDELGIFKILSYSELKPELTQFFDDVLEPLVKYDREKGHELVETLKKYFEYRGNVKKISEVMFTHYNTIVYRMNRIKKITNMDFENSNDYLNMQVAIKIYEMMD